MKYVSIKFIIYSNWRTSLPLADRGCYFGRSWFGLPMSCDAAHVRYRL